jgi:hypothetical protein
MNAAQWQAMKATVRRARNRGLIIAGVSVACCAVSSAQTFYKWTDERGVVHLADEPPVNVHGVEERQLPPPPPPPEQLAGDAAEAPVAPAAKNPPAASAPPQVIVVSRQVVRGGPTTAHVVGEVKNVGGQNAEAVEITLRSVDANQGTLCLNEQAGVAPAVLPPGESGRFDADIDSPCLAGDTPVDIVPVWK